MTSRRMCLKALIQRMILVSNQNYAISGKPHPPCMTLCCRCRACHLFPAKMLSSTLTAVCCRCCARSILSRELPVSNIANDLVELLKEPLSTQPILSVLCRLFDLTAHQQSIRAKLFYFSCKTLQL